MIMQWVPPNFQFLVLWSAIQFNVHPAVNTQVKCMSWVRDGVWISLRRQPILRLFDAYSYTLLQEIDLSTILIQSLGQGFLLSSTSIQTGFYNTALQSPRAGYSTVPRHGWRKKYFLASDLPWGTLSLRGCSQRLVVVVSWMKSSYRRVQSKLGTIWKVSARLPLTQRVDI
ncbi:unnamed protein product [Schistocephalus solidus]|uniref:Uncharacterized protein n=1 Tax=Schistocephalus solidus TaxID=70667 RepID=A0A3P7D3Y8_SCHSO|nr:unnamed protein product [Schistocephalus solidus]